MWFNLYWIGHERYLILPSKDRLACSKASSVSFRSSWVVAMLKRPASITSFAMSILVFWILFRTRDSMLSAYLRFEEPLGFPSTACMKLKERQGQLWNDLEASSSFVGSKQEIVLCRGWYLKLSWKQVSAVKGAKRCQISLAKVWSSSCTSQTWLLQWLVGLLKTGCWMLPNCV